MRLSSAALEDYVADATRLLERLGATLDPHGDVAVRRSPAGRRWFNIGATLPADPSASPAVVVVRELWRDTAGDVAERVGYTYELRDPGRGYRQALHLHHRDWFADRFQVIVHEHCENPIGESACDHYAGFPVRDAFAAVELLVGTWLDPASPDCTALICLEPG